MSSEINKKPIIALTGKAMAGKDTFADLHENCEKLAFARPLKDAVKILFNFTNEQLYDPSKKEEIDERWGKSPRQILQFLGTEVLRDQINKEFFTVNMKQRILETLSKENVKGIIITDARFENEIQLIKDLGGKIIKIKRPGAKTTEHCDHATEQEIPDHLVDLTIINDGSIEDLRSHIVF